MSEPSVVGSRELKTRLGTYLARVRAGETILVTDRGTPVAELRPVGALDDPLDEALRKLAAEGVVTLPAEDAPAPSFEPVRPRTASTGSRAVSADRDERG